MLYCLDPIKAVKAFFFKSVFENYSMIFYKVKVENALNPFFIFFK